jgi:hypothetical protein
MIELMGAEAVLTEQKVMVALMVTAVEVQTAALVQTAEVAAEMLAEVRATYDVRAGRPV